MIDNLFSRRFFISFAVLYCSFKSYPYIPYTKYTTFLLVAYGTLFFIYRIIKNKKNLIFADMFFAYSYFVVSIISFIVNGMKMEQGFYKLCIEFFSIFCALFLYMPRNIDDTNDSLKEDFAYLMKILLVATFIIGLINVLSIFFPEHFTIDKGNPIGFAGEKFHSRFNGILGNSNRLGQFAITSIPSSIYILCADRVCKNNTSNINMYIFKKLYIHKFLYSISIVNLVIQLLCCILSGSRATYINLLLYLILFIYIFVKNNNEAFNKYKKIIIAIIVVFIIFCMTYYFLSRGISFKISDRTGLYIIALNMYIHNNLLFGSSFGRYMEAWYLSMNDLVKVDSFYNGLSMHAFNPHNTFLRALCLHGMIGFLIIFSLFIYTLYRIIKLFKNVFINNDYELNVTVIILFMYFVNAIMGTISDGLILTNNLWMINNLLSMVSFGYIAQFYNNLVASNSLIIKGIDIGKVKSNE